MQIRSAACSLGIAVLVLSVSGCLVRTRTLDKRQVNTSNLLVSDLPQLVERINSEARKVHSFSATVEIATSLGGAKKGKVTDIQQIKGYILEKDPDLLHVIGLLPIVRSRAFDMVSDGKTFKLSIPPMNKFIVGPAEEPAQPSTTNTLENLRPSVFFDSLLLHEIGPNEVAVLEQGTDVVQDTNNKKKSWELPTYIVNVIVRDGEAWRLQRRITFSRIDLKPHRQMIYDRGGAVATEAAYDNFADFQGVNFPSQITINRPKEEYSIHITIEKIEVNKPLTEDQFVLAQPPGAQVKVLK
jgi:outer membrane lipoprotein-sorting protein